MRHLSPDQSQILWIPEKYILIYYFCCVFDLQCWCVVDICLQWPDVRHSGWNGGYIKWHCEGGSWFHQPNCWGNKIIANGDQNCSLMERFLFECRKTKNKAVATPAIFCFQCWCDFFLEIVALLVHSGGYTDDFVVKSETCWTSCDVFQLHLLYECL